MSLNKFMKVITTILVLLFTSLLFSQEESSARTMKFYYKAAANGLAEIKLKIYNDETFELYFYMLDDGTEATWTGKAAETNRNIILTFGDDKPTLSDLFDEN